MAYLIAAGTAQRSDQYLCRHSWVVAIGIGVYVRLSGAVGFRGLLNIRK